MSSQNIDDIAYIKSKVRNIPDFPKPGIQFKDITTLLHDPKALRLTADLLVEPFSTTTVDYVLGIESRGFLFGPGLAQDLNAGFIPLRKPGKLPAETLHATYELEYGTDRIEIHKDAIKKGDKVLIHDDLIATGGSALAVTGLIEQIDAKIVGYSFVMALKALNGLGKLPNDFKKSVLLNL